MLTAVTAEPEILRSDKRYESRGVVPPELLPDMVTVALKIIVEFTPPAPTTASVLTAVAITPAFTEPDKLRVSVLLSTWGLLP